MIYPNKKTNSTERQNVVCEFIEMSFNDNYCHKTCLQFVMEMNVIW